MRLLYHNILKISRVQAMKNGYISTLVKNIMSKYYPLCWFVSYAMVEFNVYKPRTSEL